MQQYGQEGYTEEEGEDEEAEEMYQNNYQQELEQQNLTEGQQYMDHEHEGGEVVFRSSITMETD